MDVTFAEAIEGLLDTNSKALTAISSHDPNTEHLHADYYAGSDNFVKEILFNPQEWTAVVTGNSLLIRRDIGPGSIYRSFRSIHFPIRPARLQRGEAMGAYVSAEERGSNSINPGSATLLRLQFDA